jgi:hypothetical protein
MRSILAGVKPFGDPPRYRKKQVSPDATCTTIVSEFHREHYIATTLECGNTIVIQFYVVFFDFFVTRNSISFITFSLQKQNKMSISLIPAEILTQMIEHIENYRQCRLVSRLWNEVSQINFGDRIRIRTYKTEKLLQDVREYPLLAAKVDEVSIIDSDISLWVQILNLCPNVTAFYTSLDNPGTFMEALARSPVMFTNLKVLELVENEWMERGYHHYLSFILRHSATATRLILMNEDLMGFSQCLSAFKDLKTCEFPLSLL